MSQNREDFGDFQEYFGSRFPNPESGHPKKFRGTLAPLIPDFKEKELLLKRFITE